MDSKTIGKMRRRAKDETETGSGLPAVTNQRQAVTEGVSDEAMGKDTIIAHVKKGDEGK